MASDEMPPPRSRQSQDSRRLEAASPQPQRRRNEHWKDWRDQGLETDAQAAVTRVLEVTRDRTMMTELIDLAKQSARSYARTQAGQGTAPSGFGAYIHSVATWLPSARQLAMPSSDVRETLRQVPLYPETHTDDSNSSLPPAPPTLDFARNVAHRLKREIDDLGTEDGLANIPHLSRTKKVVNEAVDELLNALSMSAYDKSNTERAYMAMCLAPTLAMCALSLAYCAYSRPPGWLYMGTQARGLAQTLPTIGGILGDPAPSKEMVGIVNRERGVLWGTPALQYCVAAFMLAYALDHPENQVASHAADKALKVEDSKGFQYGIAAANLLITSTVNHWKDMGDMRRMRGAKGAAISVPEITDESSEPERNLAGRVQNIRTLAVLVSNLVTVVDDVGAEMELGGAQRMHHTEVRNAASRLIDTFDTLCGGVKQSAKLLNQEQKRLKAWAAAAVIPLTAGLGAISTAAAWEIPALRTQYPVNYGLNIANLVLKTFQKSVDAHDLQRLFSSYSGSTVINLPIVVGNMVAQSKYKEGLWNIVTTDPKAHPELATTKHPQLHVLDGKLNFSALMTWSAVATMAWGSKAGEVLSDGLQKLIRGYKKSLDLPEMPGLTEQQTQHLQRLFGNLARSEGLSVDQAVEHARIEEIPETSTSKATDVQQRIKEHWATLSDAQKTGTSWDADQLRAFAQSAGYQQGYKTEAPLGAAIQGVALNATQVALLSAGQQQNQLRIVTLLEGDRVDGRALTPGAVVKGDIDRLKTVQRDLQRKRP